MVKAKKLFNPFPKLRKCQAVQMIVKENQDKRFYKLQSASLNITSMVMVLEGILCHIHNAKKKEQMHSSMAPD